MNSMYVLKSIMKDEIKCIYPARIERFDNTTMTADIVLLHKFLVGSKYVEVPVITDVPVSTIKAGKFIIIPPYKKNDIVLCAVSDMCLNGLLVDTNPKQPELKRQHDLADIIVIGGMQSSVESLPQYNSNDLVIHNTETQTGITIKDNGDIVLGKENPLGNLDLMEFLNGLMPTISKFLTDGGATMYSYLASQGFALKKSDGFMIKKV